MKSLIIILIAYISFNTLEAKAQQWVVYNTFNSQIPSNGIRCIEIDSNNTKWIGTGSGLVRIAGNNWTIFDTTNSKLPRTIIFSLALEGRDIIWIGTSNALYRFDGSIWKKYDSTNSVIPRGTIWNILVKDHFKWLCTTLGGLGKFNDSSWTVYNTSNSGLTENWIECIAIDTNNIKWIGMHSKGMFKFNDTNWVNFNTLNSPLRSSVININVDNTNKKWISDGYLKTFRDSDSTWFIFDSTNAIFNFISNSETIFLGDSLLWMSTLGFGIYKYNYNNWTNYNENNSGLPANGTRSIRIDKYNNKWIATAGGGLAIFNETGIVNIDNNKLVINNFELKQNYPNPFNPSTNIEFSISKKTNIDLTIYDINGRKISKLINSILETGNYKVQWNAEIYPSGVYFYKLSSGNSVITKKMILIK